MTPSRFLLPLAVAMFLPSLAYTAPTVDVSFGDDPLGGPPSTNLQTAPGEPLIKPWSISDPSGMAGLFTVNHDFQCGSAKLEGRSVVMHVSNEPEGSKALGGQLNIKGHIADFEEGIDYSLTLDLLFNGNFGVQNAGALMINLYNSTFAGAGYQAQLVFANGSVSIYPGGIPAERVDVMNVWNYDETFEVEVRMRYSTKTLELLINGQEVGTVSIASAKEPQGVGGIQLVNASESSHYEVGIAKIRGEAIPEP